MLVCFTLSCILINIGGLRPKVRSKLTNKKPKASTYQSSTKVEESLIRDAMKDQIDHMVLCWG
jgi:hypothetical protein